MRVQVRPTAKTRKRRRRRRLITFLAYLVVVFGLAWFFESQGTTTIVFVRHAETDQSMSTDSDLPMNESGKVRAMELADWFEDFDVAKSVDAIYVDETLRTQQTAEPLAKRIGITPETADHSDVVGFTGTVLREHKREVVLVVTHKSDISPLVEELHGSKNIAEIAADDYDDVYIVVIPWFGKVKTLHGHY